MIFRLLVGPATTSLALRRLMLQGHAGADFLFTVLESIGVLLGVMLMVNGARRVQRTSLESMWRSTALGAAHPDRLPTWDAYLHNDDRPYLAWRYIACVDSLSGPVSVSFSCLFVRHAIRRSLRSYDFCVIEGRFRNRYLWVYLATTLCRVASLLLSALTTYGSHPSCMFHKTDETQS
jgi:hypothetical protein